MELVEPLLMTVGSIRSLVKNNQDIGQEVVELGSTIGLIEGAIAPLRSFHSEADSHLTQVLKALQDCLNSAKTALERVAEKSKKKFLFFFRSGIELDELRSYQDKLKTLCPILSLAITAQQQHFRHQEHQQQMNSLKRRGNGDDARRRREGGEEEEEEEMEEEERKRRRKEQDDCDFDATNILKSEDAARFWRLHFGAKTYKVSWERFKAAFEHEYGPSVTKDEESLSILRDRLDKDHDGLIDVYEVASFVATGGRGKEAGSNSNNGGNNSSLLQCFKTAVLQHRKQKLVAPTNSKSRNHLKTRSLSWGSISDSHTRKPVPNVSSMSEQQPPLQHTVMGPPPASPQKRKFKLAPNTVTTSGGNSAASSSSLSSESNKTETKKRGAEEMRGDDTDDQTFGFMLLLFGKSSIMKLRACQDENVTKVKKTWDPQTPFVVGRIHFEKLPKELLLRISRAHFEIHCTENNVPASATPQKQYWIIDKSGNGTFLNGKRMQKNTKMRLHDGDMIGIITEKRKEEVEMGYLFKIIEPSSFNADPKQQSLSSSQKRLRRSANNEDDSENKESEEEQLPCTPPQQHKVPTIVVTPPASPSSSASPPSSASSSASTCSPLSSLSSHPTSDDLDSSASPPPSVTTTASSSSPYRSPQRALSRSAPPMSPSRIPTSIPSRASPSPSSASRRRLHSTSPKTLRLEEEESERVDSTPILGRK